MLCLSVPILTIWLQAPDSIETHTLLTLAGVKPFNEPLPRLLCSFLSEDVSLGSHPEWTKTEQLSTSPSPSERQCIHRGQHPGYLAPALLAMTQRLPMEAM